MTIPVPSLDDQTWLKLVSQAADRMKELNPDWKADPHDPGMVLIDVFAHLTDILMYRLNRVPDRMYSVFLNYIGAAALHAPAAAETTLEFRRTATEGSALIPAGTRVTVAGASPTAGARTPVFVTALPAELGVGEESGRVRAIDYESHQAEIIGVGSGAAGQRLSLTARPALEGQEVRIGMRDDDVPTGQGVLVEAEKFRYFRRVETFADADPDEYAFVVDLVSGEVTFAPAVTDDAGRTAPLARVPEAGRQVRAWYFTGGGSAGNLPVDRLTVPLDSLPSGVTVSNVTPATGGRDVESVEQARLRAPQEFHLRQRAVTAHDYELLAKVGSAGAVSRAYAFTRNAQWEFADPGQVEVVLVPEVRPDDQGWISESQMRGAQDEASLNRVRSYLQERATLGADCVVRWADYKVVGVEATVVIRADADPVAVEQRLRQRVNAAISPLQTEQTTGSARAFGGTLWVSNINRLLEEHDAGVRYVRRLTFTVPDLPQRDVVAIVSDHYQPDTWFAAAGDAVYRTTNGARGWERSVSFPGEVVVAVACHPKPLAQRAGGRGRPGLVAVLTHIRKGPAPDAPVEGSRVHVSSDLGSTWQRVQEITPERFLDLAWVERGDAESARLLLAGAGGLYEVVPVRGGELSRLTVDPDDPDAPLYAVQTFTDQGGQQGVLVAQQGRNGLWIARDPDEPSRFEAVRTAAEDIHHLSVQYEGPITYLWGARADSRPTVNGCVRLRLDDLAGLDPHTADSQWETFDEGWQAGECWDLAFSGSTVYAATEVGGVLRMDLSPGGDRTWQSWSADSGLPLESDQPPRLKSIQTVSSSEDGTVLLAGSEDGVYQRDSDTDNGARWVEGTASVVRDAVTLPPTWLFCSGDHRITVLREDDRASR